MMTARDRLAAAAHCEEVDRTPCICPGGMMNMIVTEVMEQADSFWPEAHQDAGKMARLARTLNREGGFENYGVPFCMTVEAEAMGAKVDLGGREVEPHVVESPLSSAAEADRLRQIDLDAGRTAVVLEAIRLLRKGRDVDQEQDMFPIVGNITGPVSVAGTLVDMSTLLMELCRQPEACHHLLGLIADQLIIYGQAQCEAGADAVCISEPSGTGEILGGRLFRAYTVPYINRVLDALTVPVKIVHICGRLHSVYTALADLHCDAFSFDAVVNIEEIRPYLRGKAVMGNVSTHAIGTMPPGKVAQLAHSALAHGVDILAPACGLPLTAPLKNIRAMVGAAVAGNDDMNGAGAAVAENDDMGGAAAPGEAPHV